MAGSGRAGRAVTVQLPAGPETRTGSASTKSWEKRVVIIRTDGSGQARTPSTKTECAGYLAETRRRIAVRSPLESLHDSVQYVSQGPR